MIFKLIHRLTCVVGFRLCDIWGGRKRRGESVPTDFIHHKKKGPPLCPHRVLWFHRRILNVLLLECSYLQIDEDNMNKIFAAYTVHMLRNYNDKLVLHKPADFSVIKLKLTLKFYMYELHTFKCWHVLSTLVFFILNYELLWKLHWGKVPLFYFNSLLPAYFPLWRVFII